MRVLITGITGFAGSWLAEYCLEKGCEVYGTIRWRSNTDNIKHLKGKIHLHECDIRDGLSVNKAIAEIKPDRIFHLAAQSYVKSSWHAPVETLTTNIIGEVNLFEAVRTINVYNPTIMIAGSSEEYGLTKEDELPINEHKALQPLSPYAVSKVGQDLLGYQYYKSYGLNIVRTRAFNHTGPRRGGVFVCSDFAQQIARIEKGLQKPEIRVGNLEAKRDFTDVRDMIKAYWLALEKGILGEVYNICSGKAYSIQQVLGLLLGLSNAKIEIKHDQERMRPSDVPVLTGDSTKFREQTGWKPEIPMEKTLEDLLHFWREKGE